MGFYPYSVAIISSFSGDKEQTEQTATISVVFCGYHLDFFMSNWRSQEGHA